MTLEMAKEFIRGLYLQYSSNEYPNSISIKDYDTCNLPFFLKKFNLTFEDYIIESFNDVITVFLYNKHSNTYERVYYKNHLIPGASITYSKNNSSNIDDAVYHGKLGYKKPIEKCINGKIYIADHWLPEYVYVYKIK